MNPIWLPRNLVDSTDCTVTDSPSCLSTLPVTNLQLQARKKTARSTGLDGGSPSIGQTFKYSWGAAKSANMSASRYHNLTAGAVRRFIAYSDNAWSVSLYDTGYMNAFAYTGLSADVVVSDADFRIFKNSAIYFPTITGMQSAIEIISDPTNPDGYIETSRSFIGQAMEFGYHVPYGAFPMTICDMSVQARAEDGSLVTDKREKYVRIDLDQKLFTSSADWAKLLATINIVGKDRDFWFSLFPGLGTFQEMYHQGAFKLGDDPAVDRYFLSLVRTKLTLLGN